MPNMDRNNILGRLQVIQDQLESAITQLEHGKANEWTANDLAHAVIAATELMDHFSESE